MSIKQQILFSQVSSVNRNNSNRQGQGEQRQEVKADHHSFGMIRVSLGNIERRPFEPVVGFFLGQVAVFSFSDDGLALNPPQEVEGVEEIGHRADEGVAEEDEPSVVGEALVAPD